MCGIAGFLLKEPSEEQDSLLRTATKMADTIVHRGPDDGGIWGDCGAGIGLGFRRLAIQDLSPAGKQPMLSHCGRYVIVFNGEIYNFCELSKELEKVGAKFNGHSDTEVLLSAISHWGLEIALERINGMFAFALWNREKRSLTLARDRAGKKPLYYGWCNGTFLFASELKALRAHPAFAAEIDRKALGLFVQYSWVPAPYSIYQDVRKLPAGCFLTITNKLDPRAADAAPKSYWSARDKVERGIRDPFAGSYEEATDALEARLRRAVGSRMIADVGLGALLSGGIDSSLVVAIMQSMSDRPIKTFTIGFREDEYNEAVHAAAVANHLRTDHTELYITPRDCLNVVPKLPTLYDEPFADSSQIPTFLVSELARREVTVALSGDGGDELFVGYAAYQRCLDRWERRGGLPLSVNQNLGRLLHSLANGLPTLKVKNVTGSDRNPLWRLAGKVRKKANALSAAGPVDLYATKRLRCKEEEGFVLGSRGARASLFNGKTWSGFEDPVVAMTYLDFMTYLVDDILVKVDRASMGVSLEVRAPILDRDVIEFAWRLPVAMKYGPSGGKRILRDVLARHVPRALFERPKAGFSMPVAQWLSGPLRDWAESLLNERQLREQGLLNSKAVVKAWADQVSGRRNRQQLIWSILMFQAWLEALKANRQDAPGLHATA